MIRTYETVRELADELTKGEGMLHLFNCPQDDMPSACAAWQTGINNLAEWLDHLGVKVQINDKAEDFYQFVARKGVISREIK